MMAKGARACQAGLRGAGLRAGFLTLLLPAGIIEACTWTTKIELPIYFMAEAVYW